MLVVVVLLFFQKNKDFERLALAKNVSPISISKMVTADPPPKNGVFCCCGFSLGEKSHF